jgi:cell division septal protein FtsQ
MVKHKSYRKSYRIKKIKSIFGNRFFWLTLLTLIIIGGVFYFIAFSSTFQIKEIKISGNQKVSTENLRDVIDPHIFVKVWGFPSRSIFLANFNEINRIILEKFPQIWQVNLKRRFLNTVLVQIEERIPIAIFYQAENNFLIDKEGIIFDPVRNDISNGVEKVSYGEYLKLQNLTLKRNLNLGEKAIEKELLSQILEINSKLKENLKIDIEEFIIPTEGRLNVKTIEGWKIYFNLKGDMGWQLTELSLILKERIPPEKRRSIEYIDLRFGKVYIFPETYWR